MLQELGQLHSFQVRHPLVVIPLLDNGSSRIGLLALVSIWTSSYSTNGVRPFNSEGHSVSALLPRLHHLLPGSLEIALKRTRPRQRFGMLLGGILRPRREAVKGKFTSIPEYH